MCKLHESATISYSENNNNRHYAIRPGKSISIEYRQQKQMTYVVRAPVLITYDINELTMSSVLRSSWDLGDIAQLVIYIRTVWMNLWFVGDNVWGWVQLASPGKPQAINQMWAWTSMVIRIERHERATAAYQWSFTLTKLRPRSNGISGCSKCVLIEISMHGNIRQAGCCWG